MSAAGPASADRPPRTVVIARLGLAVAVISPIVILVSPGRPLTLFAVLMFAALGFGPAVTCWLDSGDPIAQFGLTVIISLGGYAIFATFLIWWHIWHPDLLLLIAIPTVASCGRRLAGWRRSGDRRLATPQT